MLDFRIEDLEFAREIAQALNIPEEFGSGEYEDFNGDDAITFIEHQLDDLDICDYHIDCGVSKMVINIDSLPFVIKIPFNGYWSYNWDDDEDSDSDEAYFVEFYYADSLGNSQSYDYCHDELKKTALAHEKGFGCFIPAMRELCRVCGRAVYVQEKAVPLTVNRTSSHIPSEDSLNKAKEFLRLNEYWCATAIDFYGLDFFENFISWSKKINMLFDMHYGNYGYDMSGRPVLFDISGFRD